MKVQLIQGANAILGEGPTWCDLSNSLYWIDIKRSAIYRYTPGEGQTGFWLMPELLGSVAVASDGQLLAALQSGMHVFNPSDGTLRQLAQATMEFASQRYNDGAVDRHGRFWVGTIADDGGSAGNLYRFDGGSRSKVALRGLICANGLGWSPDGATMYVTDSGRRAIFAYDIDSLTGELTNERTFAVVQTARGVPDGLAVDEQGFVWSAIWDGWCVNRYAPDGRLVLSVELPVQRPTSVAFGGSDLMTLFVTSASVNVSVTGLSQGPLAGGLFEIEAGVSGLPQNRLAPAFFDTPMAAA